MSPSNFLKEFLGNLEDRGELAPGSAPVIYRDLPRPLVDVPHALAVATAVIYGSPALELDGESVPASPASPYLLPTAPSLKLPPVPAALSRLSFALRGADTEAVLTKRFVELTTLPPALIGSTIMDALLKGRDDGGHTRLRSDYVPELSRAESTAVALIRDLQSEGIIAHSVDASELGRAWKDLGNRSRAEALRVIKLRLSDPTRAELSPNGEPVRWLTNDLDGTVAEVTADTVAELDRHAYK